MTLLDIITEAAANPTSLKTPFEYPIILNTESIFLNTKPHKEDEKKDISPITPLDGWRISDSDSEFIKSVGKFFKILNRKSKNRKEFGRDEFISRLHRFFDKNKKRFGVSADPSYRTPEMLREKLSYPMGRNLAALIAKICVDLEVWDALGFLIRGGIIPHSNYRHLVCGLCDKRRTDMLFLCLQYFHDLLPSDLLAVLKHLLSPPANDGAGGAGDVRKQWEATAMAAVEKAGDQSMSPGEKEVARRASILMMISYDGFSASELCLHLLVSSCPDYAVFSSAVAKLGVAETVALVSYLGKWVRKYERFPEAGPCPEAEVLLGIQGCLWVPRLEQIVRCLGVVVDRHFLTIVLHKEFHEELRSVAALVHSFASESRFYGCVVYRLRRLIASPR